MPATVSHQLSATTPDDPLYEIRPSHWNATHVVTFAAVGSEISGAFGNGGGVTFGLSADGKITASAPAAGGGLTNINVSAGTTSQNLSAITFADSNGISFGLNGSTLTGSHNALTSQSNQAFSAEGGSSAFQTLNFRNANGLSFSNSDGSVQASYTVPSTVGLISAVNFSAGTTSGNVAAVTFGDLNGVTFGYNGGTITASVAAVGGAQTGISGIIVSNTTYTSGTVSFSNANGISFGSSAGQAITASYTVPTVPAQFTGGFSTQGNTLGDTGLVTGRMVLVGGPNITLSGSTNGGSITISVSGGAGAAGNTGYLSAGTATASLGTISFADSNGVSFGVNGQTITATVKTDYLTTQTNQTIGFYGSSQTTGSASSGTLDARSVSIIGAGGISVGMHSTSAGGTTTGLLISGPALATTISGVSSANVIGTNKRYAAEDHQHVGVYSIGVSNVGNTAGDTAVRPGQLVFAGGNNITLSGATAAGSLQTITISAAAQTNQTVGLYALGNTTQNSSTTLDARTLSFNGLGGMTVGYSNGSIQLSAPQTVAQTNQQMTMFATGNTTQSSTGTMNASSIIFRGSNNVSVGISNGSVIIDAAGGGVNPAASASNGSFAFTTLNFSNANNVTFGTSAGGIITASVAAPGAAAENNWMHALGANTAGNTTASGTTIGWSGINLTISGTNGSVLNLSVPASSSMVGTSGISLSTAGSTLSVQLVPALYWRNLPLIGVTTTIQPRQSTSYIFPFAPEVVIAPGFLRAMFSGSIASTSFASTGNTSYSYNLAETHNWVVYSRGVGASSMSLQSVFSTSVSIGFSWRHSRNTTNNISVSYGMTYPMSTGTSSFSGSYAATNSSNQHSTTQFTNITGMRFLDIPFSTTLTANQYWLAYGVSTAQTTQGTANLSAARAQNWIGAVTQANNAVNFFNAATNSSVMYQLALGSFTTNAIGTTDSLPMSVVSSLASQPIPYIQFLRVT